MGSKKSKHRKPAVRGARRPLSRPTASALPPSSASPAAMPTSTTSAVGDATDGSAPPPAPEAREGVADSESSAAGPSPPPPPAAAGCTSPTTPAALPRPGPPPCLLLSPSPRCPPSDRISTTGDLPVSASSGPPRPPSGAPHSIPPAGGGLWAAMSPLVGGTPHSASSGFGPSPEGLLPLSSAHRASPPPIHSHRPLLAPSRSRPPSAVGGVPPAAVSSLGASEPGCASAGPGPLPEGVPPSTPGLMAFPLLFRAWCAG